ncbi:MAG: DUF748 domain-containing protein [Lentisphaeria bacterium]|nr:DUF748 domain-containing protein [Lentisphaeria bacterium]
MKAKNKRRLRNFSIFTIVVYTLLNFIIVPLIINKFIIPKIETKYELQIDIKKLRIHLLEGSVRIENLKAQFLNKNLAGLEKLYVDIAFWKSISQKRFVIEKIELGTPNIDLYRDKNGTLNIERLIEKFPKSEESKESQELFLVDLNIENASASFQDLAVSRDFQYILKDVDFRLQDFSSKVGSEKQSDVTILIGKDTEIVWNGEIKLSPLSSKGQVHVKKMNLADFDVYYDVLTEKLDVSKGWCGTKFKYEFSPFEEKPKILLDLEYAQLYDFAVIDEDTKETFQSLGKWRIEGLKADVSGANISVEKVYIDQGVSAVFLTQNGDINYLPNRLLMVSKENLELEKKQPIIHNRRMQTTLLDLTKPLREKIQELWKSSWVSVADNVEVKNYQFVFYDDFHGNRKKLSIDEINLKIHHIQNLNELTKFELDFKYSDQIQKLSGELLLGSLKGDFNVSFKDLPLVELSPYVNDILGVEIYDGAFNLDASLHIEMEEHLEKFKQVDLFSDFHLDNFHASMRDHSIKLSKLSLKKIYLDLLKQSLFLEEIYLLEPEIQSKITLPQSSENTSIEPEKSTRESILSKMQIKEKIDWHLKVQDINVLKSQINLEIDGFLNPLSLNVNQHDTKIVGFSSQDKTLLEIKSKGRINEYGSFDLDVKTPLNSPSLNGIFNLYLEELPLNSFSSASQTYTHYGLDRGDFSFKFISEFKNNKLNGELSVLSDGLRLGDYVEGDGRAINLPIKLGLAIMTDINNQIKLDGIEISGDLSQPEFRIYSVIWYALKNICVKLVTSPFRYLSSLVGGSEDIQNIDFESGEKALTAESIKSLEVLSDIMFKRPAIDFDFKYYSISKEDIQALKLKELDLQISYFQTTEEYDPSSAESPLFQYYLNQAKLNNHNIDNMNIEMIELKRHKIKNANGRGSRWVVKAIKKEGYSEENLRLILIDKLPDPSDEIQNQLLTQRLNEVKGRFKNKNLERLRFSQNEGRLQKMDISIQK